jgi:hypothetical protein
VNDLSVPNDLEAVRSLGEVPLSRSFHANQVIRLEQNGEVDFHIRAVQIEFIGELTADRGDLLEVERELGEAVA